MPHENEETGPTKTPAELAQIAVNYFLTRVACDENIRYHAGAFTELYNKMRAAHMALNNQTEDQVDAQVFGGTLPYKAAAAKLDDVREILDSVGGEIVHGSDLVQKLREAIC